MMLKWGTSFNSTLVQLKANGRQRKMDYSQVSILP